MKIGIDISQTAYQGSGAARFTKKLVEHLLKIDEENQYLLFYSSLRRPLEPAFIEKISNPRVEIKQFRLPPALLDFLWNKLHIISIERLSGPLDVFLSSDWTQPPSQKAKLATVIHDLSFLKFPQEHHARIRAVQKRRLKWIVEECDLIICVSQATKKDVQNELGVNEEKLKVIYEGV